MWETILLAYGILFALVLIVTAVSKRNRPRGREQLSVL